MPRQKRDHSNSLKALCCSCGRKPPRDGNLRSVRKAWEPALAKCVPGFKVGSNLHPQSLCDTCRRILAPLFKDLNANVAKPPVLVDWTKILPTSSRISGKKINHNPGEVCPCGICDIARLNGSDFNSWHKAHSRPAGSPPNLPKVKISQRCGDCHSEIEPEMLHSCSKTEERAGLTGLARHTSTATLSNVGANSLRTLAENQGISTRGVKVSLQSARFNKLPVMIGRGRTDENKERIITNQDLEDLQNRVRGSEEKLKDTNFKNK